MVAISCKVFHCLMQLHSMHLRNYRTNSRANAFCGLTGFGNGMLEKHGQLSVLLHDLMSTEIQGWGKGMLL